MGCECRAFKCWIRGTGPALGCTKLNARAPESMLSIVRNLVRQDDNKRTFSSISVCVCVNAIVSRVRVCLTRCEQTRAKRRLKTGSTKRPATPAHCLPCFLLSTRCLVLAAHCSLLSHSAFCLLLCDYDYYDYCLLKPGSREYCKKHGKSKGKYHNKSS